MLIISTCKEKLSELEFVRPIQLLTKGKVKHYSEVSKDDVEKADKIIICGTALKDFDYLEGDFSWLKEYDKPVLGICAGMQIIATTFGVPLQEFEAIGPKKVTVVKENKLIEGEFNAYFLHTKTGIGDFQVLAETDGQACMIKHPERDIYGCIFHPEVMNEKLIMGFIQ